MCSLSMVPVLVCDHDTHLVLVERPLEHRVPEHDLAARSESGREGVRCLGQVADLLHPELHVLLSRLAGDSFRIGRQLGLRRAEVRHEVRRHKGEQYRQRNEDGSGREPPPFPQRRPPAPS